MGNFNKVLPGFLWVNKATEISNPLTLPRPFHRNGLRGLGLHCFEKAGHPRQTLKNPTFKFVGRLPRFEICRRV
jgi:hypothetical protein